MRIALPAVADRPPALRPMRAALARMVAALRAVVGVAAVISALLGAGGPLSWWWLMAALFAVTSWTSFYVIVAWARGLKAWLLGADLLLTAALFLAIGHLVPALAVPGTANWVSTIASMAVVSAQLAGRPAMSVPAGLLVAACAVVGLRLGHSPDGGRAAAILLSTQAVVAAAVMVVAIRTERTAVRAFAELAEAQAVAALAAARRADERAQLRLVHNGPLTTLTMALHAEAGRPGSLLQRRAVAALQDLPRLAVGVAARGGQVSLDERLDQVVAWYQPLLTVAAELPSCLVPGYVAEAFAGAVAEALENVVRHAGTGQAAVRLTDLGHEVEVTVTDQGRGFDPAQPPGGGFGLREDLTGRMADIGGTAVVRSSPGAGTMVCLGWRRG
jgi:hypothetical protein